MTFKEAQFNTTEQHSGGNILTGSKDAIFLRNRYQTELDNAHAAFVNMVHHIEDNERSQIIHYFHLSERLEKDITAHISERDNLYKSLDELLEKELGQEYSMFKLKPQGLSVTTSKLSGGTHIQGFGSSGIVNTAPLRYLEKYPDLQTKSSFASIMHKINEKEREIRNKAESFNESISHFKATLPHYESDVNKCDSKLIFYNNILNEWNDKRSNCKYFNSAWFKLLTLEKKTRLLPDTLTHRIQQFTNSLNIFKSEVTHYKSHKYFKDN